MTFERELIDKVAPGADCLPAMRIWKMPSHREKDFFKICESGEYFAELKKDGYWFQFEKTIENNSYMFSRVVSERTGVLSERIASLPHIKTALLRLPPGTTLIGEIYFRGKTSKSVAAIMNCLPEKAVERQKERGFLIYYVHDIIKLAGVDLKGLGAWERFNILEKLWSDYSLSFCEDLELAAAVTENIYQFAADAIANGEEGVVLKKKTAPYSPSKSPAWHTIKVKKFDSLDAICMGFCDGTAEYEGTQNLEDWPYWMDPKTKEKFPIQSSDNSRIPIKKPHYFGWRSSMVIGALTKDMTIKEIGHVSSGLGDTLRSEFAKHPEKYINKVVSIRCMEKDNKAKTLRHASLVEFREDKGWKDCLMEYIFSEGE